MLVILLVHLDKYYDICMSIEKQQQTPSSHHSGFALGVRPRGQRRRQVDHHEQTTTPRRRGTQPEDDDDSLPSHRTRSKRTRR